MRKTFARAARFALSTLLFAITASVSAALPTPTANAAAATAAAASENATVDVLVVYTAAARDYLGGEDAVRAEINAMVEETNDAFEKSGVTGAVRLAADAATGDASAGARLAVNADGTAYVESTVSFENDLTALSDWRTQRGSSSMVVSPDSSIPDVHQWRNDTRADIVVLLRHGSVQNTAGIAWTLDSTDGSPAGGFAVVGAQLNTYCFPHELGHTFGLLHDRANSSGATGAFDYAYGYIFTGTSGAEHGTIMSYAQGEARIGYFSTPLLEFDGVPLGLAEGTTTTTTDSRGRTVTSAVSADCVRALNQTLPVVATYRVPTLPAPVITTPESATPHNGTLYVKVEIPDGTFGVVRYTTDGSPVTASSPAATSGTITLTPDAGNTAQAFRVRARVFTDDAESGATPLHGPEATAAYTVIADSAVRAVAGARLAAGNTHSLFIDAANATYAAGDNALGQSGAGYSASTTGGTALQLDDGTDGNPAESVSAYANHTVVIAANNVALLFGSNSNGQLGTGNTVNARGGVAEQSSYSSQNANGARGERYIVTISNVLLAATGGAHTALLDLTGQLYTVGANERGQLGDGTTTERREFTAINYAAGEGAGATTEEGGEAAATPVNDATRLAAGNAHTLFINAAGDLYGFGDNASGQLARDPNATPLAAAPVKIAANATAAAAGDANTYFLDADGALHALGANDRGQLGSAGSGTSAVGTDGAFSATPVRVATGVAQIAAGHKHALFITTGGDLYGFGDNSAGQLGLDPNTTPFSATPLLLASNVVAAAGGASHTLYAAATGAVDEATGKATYVVFALGANAAGQLGDASLAAVTTTAANTGITYAVQPAVTLPATQIPYVPDGDDGDDAVPNDGSGAGTGGGNNTTDDPTDNPSDNGGSNNTDDNSGGTGGGTGGGTDTGDGGNNSGGGSPSAEMPVITAVALDIAEDDFVTETDAEREFRLLLVSLGFPAEETAEPPALVREGARATFTVTAVMPLSETAPAFTFRWEVLAAGGDASADWSQLGETAETTFAAELGAGERLRVSAEVTETGAASAPWEVALPEVVAPPVVTPDWEAGATFLLNSAEDAPSFAVSVTGTGRIYYEWQQLIDSATNTWSALPRGVSPEITITAGGVYRCAVSDRTGVTVLTAPFTVEAVVYPETAEPAE
ncbi:MAG: M12 family metallo-peptidase [Puniceicoccales bacterium]|jgi:alpha-tubulin suppressor-like RCC1 family protein|nr:M12 family metallo-peptidase [Puniceicoccales bacterium]